MGRTLFNDGEIGNPLKLSLYRMMRRIRMVEEKVAQLYPQQEMKCPCHLYIGQEAVATGVCAALSNDDYLFGTYRGHGIYLAKGGDLKTLMAELYGKVTGCTRGRGGSMQLVAPEVGLLCTSAIVGGTLPIGVGAALAAVFHKRGQVSAIVFGDAATEEGVFHESMNFASLKRLPVIFVCENNFYATYSHQSARQCADNIYERAEAYRMPGTRIDGNDVIEVYEAMRSAVERARRGEGPSLLECRTYRWREHVGPNWDTHLGYRSEEELKAWTSRCPIKLFEEALLKEGALSPDKIQQLTVELTKEIEEAVAFARKSPFPAAAELEKWVYSEST